ncbi:hypothetical protein [Yersinia pseudotuberculosis]|uniref:hypothetical protein n=1 Tax=Yersinia pseudotuberculosis TaxID=633 RepID=UPI0038CD3874
MTLNDMLYARYQTVYWFGWPVSACWWLCRCHDRAIYWWRTLLETAAGIPYDTGLLIFGISIALYTSLVASGPGLE